MGQKWADLKADMLAGMSPEESRVWQEKVVKLQHELAAAEYDGDLLADLLGEYVDMGQQLCFPNPDGGLSETRDNLYYVVVYLNDQLKWTRERIADWLEAQPVDLTIKC